MQIYNALQLKAGAKSELNSMGNLMQPLQFLPREEKDCDWSASCMTWIEWEGMKQLRRNSRRIMKNYKLGAGIIDKGDYIRETNNEYKDLVDQLAHTDEIEAMELKFYPIIPNIINTLVAEFAKRNKRISFRGSDEYSYNEILSQKQEAIKTNLFKQAEQKLVLKMIEQGMDPNDPQVQEQLKQQTSPEALKTLPEIQDFFSKDYLTLSEQWASKQHIIDEERFKMDELEERAFRDSLICDREFWHFKMMEDDYDIELWNPALTFYHKSPDVRYISEGNWVGKMDMMTTSDVIDKYGWIMNQEQRESLEAMYPVRSAGYALSGYQNETNYDATKSHAWNSNRPSLAMRQHTSVMDNFANNGGDVVNWILGQSEDFADFADTGMQRVTTAYWKSQCKIGYLTKINDAGETDTDFVEESYKVTDKPLYNNTLISNKNTNTLIFGEHIEWIWVNQVWGGVKIGPNHTMYLDRETSPGGIQPIYLGINQNEIKPLKFQFKGDRNIYGCKLPVEGRVFSDRNTKSMAPVDLMKPFQIGYNMVNNQIADILIDEIGSVLFIDQNSFPQHSLGEDWGKHNYPKAYQVMKDFQIMPLDTSMQNTENPLGMPHVQTINLEQTSRIMSRVQLANYFKAQCFENIGVVPQRMGQQIGQTNTATGIEQAVAGSYAQTEMLFVQHSDHLMPRVHQMRTDLAQYYHCKKSSIRLQTMTTNDERMNFELNGTDLLMRDINVNASAKPVHRDILKKLQDMAIGNNTSGATLFDLGKVAQADSLGTLNNTLKAIDEKAKSQRQQEMEHESQLKDKEMEQRTKEKQMENDHDIQMQEMKDRKDVLVAEIRASGFGATQDINQNQQSDFEDTMARLQKDEQYQDTINMKRESESNKSSQFQQKLGLEREKMQNQKELKQMDIAVAVQNKNRFDKPVKKDSKKKS